MTTELKTNNRTGLKIFGVLVGAGIVAYFITQVVKSLKAQENKEKEEERDLEDMGVSKEKMDSEVLPHEKQNFVKKLFVSTAYKAEAIIPDEGLDTEEAWDQSNVIHIFQRHRFEVNTEKNFKGCNNHNFLDFVLEVPDYLDKSTRLHISDYIKCMKDAADHMATKIIRFTPYAEKELFGFLKVKYENPNYNAEDDLSFPELEGFVEIPSWVYACYEDERGHGLTELYKKVILDDTFGEAEDNVQKLLSDKYPNTRVQVQYFGLAYRITFPIQDEVNGYGLVLKSALGCLDYLCNEFVVDKSLSNKYGYSSSNDETRYDHLIFHAPDENGNWTWERFYDIDRKHNQIIELEYNNR